MITALYCRKDSIYKQLGLDVFDLERDAFTWQGGTPVIAHPPCRSWGRLSHFFKHPESEVLTGYHAVEMVRRNGGVLEHPKGSKLWAACNLALPGQIDNHGGFTIDINQSWFGHKAEKKTWLYIVGVLPEQLPPAYVDFSPPTHVIENCTRSVKRLPAVTKAEREITPVHLAKWLIQICEMIPSFPYTL